MFVTFEAQGAQNGQAGLRNPKSTRRSERIGQRSSTPRACASCRRRKTKCDGKKPCESCQWYKKPELCSYSDHRPLPNKSAAAAAAAATTTTTSSPNYRGALERLFPGTAPENLVNLSREKLLDLMAPSGSQYPCSQQQGSPATFTSLETHSSALSLERPGLEALHSMPREEFDKSQSTSVSEPAEHISDDVNALSLTARHPASYLGVSSIQAALKVIAWLHPEYEIHFSRTPFKDQRNRAGNPLPMSQPALPPTEIQMVDAYFANFQPFAPLLDEEAFRATYMAGRRSDDRWLALLNIVLALGNIVSPGVNQYTYRMYFKRSMSYLNLYSLGNPNLEIIQTLGLMGGWYCHYISHPNLAYSLMGASLRMAVTLGLQREPYGSHLATDAARSASQEFKRRIWWSLCCLEIWGHETLGRPSMDFFGPSITVNLPCVLEKENYLNVHPLMENIQFVKIASKIQESLAALPTPTPAEMADLDTQLVQWWDNLPPDLKDYEPCPPKLYSVRTVMRWRFHNQRILLHRPILLNYAMRRVPLIAIRAEERAAIDKCHKYADLSIQDISTITEWNQTIGWNGVWLLFQATMVPLTLLSAISADDDESRALFETCKAQVETAILTLDRIRAYGHTAERSLEVISRIFEANLHVPEPEPVPDVNGGGSSSSSGGIAPQEFPLMNPFNGYQPNIRDGMAATSFENLWPQHMVEYLGWEANDLWPELPNLNSQNEALAFLNRIDTDESTG